MVFDESVSKRLRLTWDLYRDLHETASWLDYLLESPLIVGTLDCVEISFAVRFDLAHQWFVDISFIYQFKI